MVTFIVYLSILLFLLVMAAISVVGYRYWIKPAAYLDRVGTQTLDELGDLSAEGPAEQAGVARVIQRVGEAVPASPEKMRSMRRKLMAAGYRSESAVTLMYGIQVASAVVVGLFTALILSTTSSFGSEMVVGVSLLFTLGGYFLPSEILLMVIHRRRQILRHSLPDALDLLVICVEAGLGLDQAIMDVSEELRITHPELSEEFGLVNLELRAGKRRSEALRNLAERTGESELKKLVSILIQTDRFGTSIAQALRTHSDFMRVKRRQTAEEKASKVGVKLVFPIFFFILPSMFLVTVGPALLQLFSELFPMMRSVEK